MWTIIKTRMPAVITIVSIIAVTAVIKTVAVKLPQYHDALDYVLASLGIIGAAAVRAMFGADAPAVNKALELPDDKKAANS